MSYAPNRSATFLTQHDPLSETFSPSSSSSRSEGQPAPVSPRANQSRPTGHKRKGRARRDGPPAKPGEDFSLVVHCHLCWDWVWQRPQQFLSRLSRRRKVLFVETIGPDPELAAPLARFRTSPEFPNLTILRLQFPEWCWHNGAHIDQERRRLVQEFIAGPRAGHFDRVVQWFYDPMAVPAFAGHLGELLTVYDCMDELSRFRYAPPEIVERERALLEHAEVVFTGGRKLFEAKSQFHDNCHFYGCGVDLEHFGQARAPHTAVPPEIASLPKPVLGYFGVVDERMDYELVARLADAHPNWSVVMVGPVLKVEDHSLPRRPNLHWLGQRPYTELPALCKGFDLCLMPFALNEATEFINPTKALEYMATGRMIVSTPIADVVRNFGSVVRIGRSAEEFVALCEQALARRDPAAIERGLEMAAENSWDAIVERLEEHILEALRKKHGGKSGQKQRRSKRARQPQAQSLSCVEAAA